MKCSFASKGDQKNLLVTEDMSRRQFLRAGVGLAAVAAEFIGGCATTEPHKAKYQGYPPLPYNKIQPPKEGCLVGFFKESEADAKLKDSKFIPQGSLEIEAARKAKNIDEYVETLKKEHFFDKKKREQIDNEITYVEKGLNAKPFTFVILDSMLYFEFPVIESTAWLKGALCHLCMDILGHLTYLHQLQDLAPKKLQGVSKMVI